VGDFNVDMLTNTTIKHSLTKLANSCNLKQLINVPTRITETSKTLIDLIFTNSPNVLGSGVIPSKIADQELIYVIRKMKCKVLKRRKTISVNSFKNTNIEKFKSYLLTSPWWIIDICKSTCAAYDVFCFLVKHLVNIHAPKKKIRVKSSTPKWWTQEYAQLCRNYHSLRKCYQINDDLSNVKSSRNKLKSLKTKLKSDCMQKQLSKEKSDPRSCWNMLNDETGRHNVTTKIDKLCVGGTTFKDSEICEVLASEFSSVPSSIHATPIPSFVSNPPCNPEKQFKLPLVDPADLETELRHISARKNPGFEEIPPFILKTFASTLAAPLALLFNRSVSSSEFPAGMKKAMVIPLYKGKGLKTNPASYRPISLLPTTSKIFESIVHKKLVAFLDYYGLLNDAQHGFRKHRSTESALIKFTDDIRLSLDDKKCVGAVFVDFRKAFDLVNHKILISKLYNLNFSSSAIKWFESYLNGRCISVKLDNNYSSCHNLTHSVPQGSILGPLLFSLYINEIPNYFTNCKCILYADDLVIYASGNTMSDVNVKLQSDLDNRNKWCTLNGMIMNLDKTKCVRFKNSRGKTDDSGLNIIINNNPIENVLLFKYLGLWLDPTLSFKHHGETTMAKFVQRVRLVNRHKHGFNLSQLKMFCDALCISIPNYCLHIWTAASEGFHAKCDKIMHSMIKRLLCRSKVERRAKFEDLLEKFGWLSSLERSNYQILRFLYLHTKPSSSLYAVFSESFRFVCDTSEINLRKPKNLHIPRLNSSGGQHCFIYIAAQLWNSLPPDIQDCESFGEFDCFVRNWILTKRLDEFIYD